ncbi:MAG: HAD family hydrolase [Saprospiraceae bacterium]
MQIKNIFFDFDGVIVDSVELKTEAFYKMYLPYGEEIAKKVVEDHTNHGGVSRYAKFPKWHKEYLGLDIDEAKLHELAKAYSRLVLNDVVNAPEVTGVRAFLNKIHTTVRCWVITGTPDTEIQKIAAAKKLQDYFIGIHGSPINKTEWVDRIIKEYEIEPTETLFIGDATTDWEAAQHGNLHFALRSVPENEELFSNYNGYSFKDFIEFEKTAAYLFFE